MKIIDVGRDAILRALREFDAHWRDAKDYGSWERNRNYLHAISHRGRLYPPKKVISLATGMPLDDFHGGDPSNAYLTARGFAIVPLRAEGSAARRAGPHAAQVLALAAAEEKAGGASAYDPKDQDDGRARTLRAVVTRQGQARFRRQLIEAYQGRCAISGCALEPILEAAHTTPYLGPDTNDVSNGLLLRADLHTLWDLGLIAVDPDMLTVWISATVDDPAYLAFAGQALRMPLAARQRPSIAALRAQWDIARSKVFKD